MRKRIGQIARGKFEYAKPILTFSEEIIDFSVAKDTDETGEFVITSSDHIKIRGIVYSTESEEWNVLLLILRAQKSGFVINFTVKDSMWVKLPRVHL